MLTLNDPISIDVLKVLFSSPQMRLQRCVIRDKLLSKYSYDKDTFDVILQRKLDKLLMTLEKEYVNRSAFYSIREEMKKQVADLLKKHDFHNLIDSLDVRWINPLRKLIDRILEEKKDPYRVFNEFCFAFIGELPFVFSKDPSTFDWFMAFEERLRTGYGRDLDACMKRCSEKLGEKIDVASSKTIGACLPVCLEKIGGTIEEYFMKLGEKAKKFPFPQRMWIAEAYSEEEIEKMLDDEKKQRMHGEEG